jgi:N-acetylneuraminic acid mutarotase
VDGKIVVTGGQADQKLVRQTEVFDGKRWTDVADIPTPREHLAAASDGRYLYAVGGRDLTAAKNLPTFQRYDPESDSWTELDDMPDNAGSVAAAYVDGLVVVVGGEGVTEPSDVVQAFDVESEEWSELPALPSPRHGVAVATLGESVYAIGGAAAAGHVQATDTVNALDF